MDQKRNWTTACAEIYHQLGLLAVMTSETHVPPGKFLLAQGTAKLSLAWGPCPAVLQQALPWPLPTLGCSRGQVHRGGHCAAGSFLLEKVQGQRMAELIRIQMENLNRC